MAAEAAALNMAIASVSPNYVASIRTSRAIEGSNN
jgi:hypothetical protein